MFLQATPTDKTRTLSNKTFACGLQRYLGIDKWYALAGLDKCPHDNVDMEHHILQTCRRGGCSVPRHERLVHAIKDSINAANGSDKWALANPDLRLKKPGKSSSQANNIDDVDNDDVSEHGTLKPADFLMKDNRMFDVTVADPCTKRARTDNHHTTPGVALHTAVMNKKKKYEDAVAAVNGELIVLAWSSYGMPHYYVKKALKPLLKNRKFAWFQLRVAMSCIIFRSAGEAVHNHTLDRNELVPVQQLTLDRREQERGGNSVRTADMLSLPGSAGDDYLSNA
jgi:hypothetical protein